MKIVVAIFLLFNNSLCDRQVEVKELGRLPRSECMKIAESFNAESKRVHSRNLLICGPEGNEA